MAQTGNSAPRQPRLSPAVTLILARTQAAIERDAQTRYGLPSEGYTSQLFAELFASPSVRRTLRSFGVDQSGFQRAAAALSPQVSDRGFSIEDIAADSRRYATWLGNGTVQPEHVLYAVLTMYRSSAAATLASMGTDPGAVRSFVGRTLTVNGSTGYQVS